MCTTRKTSTGNIADASSDASTTPAQCSGCQRKGLGTCPALKSRDALLLPIINDGATAIAAAPATTIAIAAATTSDGAVHSNQP